MKELYNNLIQYLQDNFIKFKILDDEEEYLIEIDDKIYQLFEPFKWNKDEDKGIYFDDHFNWACDRTEYDYYIYYFGSVWYYLEKGQEEHIKLQPVKWLGKANLEDESLFIDTFLGIHGPFELMNGMHLYDKWCQKAKFLGITSLGLCEKGTLAAAMKFQTACQKNGIRAIQGLEVKVADEKKDIRYTIKAFVKNSVGWKNLLHLNALMNTKSTDFVTEDDIIDSSEGLVLIWDPKTIDFTKIPRKLHKFISYYQLDTVEYEKDDRDEYYLKNLKLFYKSNLKPLAMCDAYYLEKEYAPIKRKMNSLGKIVTYESDNQYMKNYQEYFEELSKLFKDDSAFFTVFEKAIKNLKEISFECNFVIETQIRHMPAYYMTDEEALEYENNIEMFRDLVIKGLEKHPDIFENYSEEEILERLEREMKVIEDGDVVDYFLILRDIINWCRENNITPGSGRGCFIPESRVKTKDGWKFIKDIVRGDIVRGEYGWNEVESKFIYNVDEFLIELELDDGRKIVCTQDHKILTKNRGYVRAIDLNEADILSEVFED